MSQTAQLGEKRPNLIRHGDQDYFTHHLLRDNYPASLSAKTRERSFDTFHVNVAARPRSATVEAFALVIDWVRKEYVMRRRAWQNVRVVMHSQAPSATELFTLKNLALLSSGADLAKQRCQLHFDPDDGSAGNRRGLCNPVP